MSSSDRAIKPHRARPRLDALTGLRFVAAALVVIYHFAQPALIGAPDWLLQVISAGHVGVSLFFMHSGFVLAYRYLDVEGTNQLDRVTFWCARLARIWPLYLLALVMTLPFQQWPASGPEWVSPKVTALLVAVSTVTFTQAWLPDLQMVWNGPGWSLSAEAFFYAVFPLLCAPLARRRSRSLLALCAGCWGVSLALPLMYLAQHPDGIASIPSYALWAGPEQARAYGWERSFWAQYVIFNPLVRLPEFVMGAALGVLFLRDQAQARRRQGPILAAIGAAGLIAGMWASAWIPYLLLNNGLLAPFCALLMYGLALGGGPLDWALSRRPMQILGEASYGLYILQVPVLIWFGMTLSLVAALAATASDFPLAAIVAVVLSDIPAWMSVVGYGITLLTTSLCAYLFVERPQRVALRHLLPTIFGGGQRHPRAPLLQA